MAKICVEKSLRETLNNLKFQNVFSFTSVKIHSLPRYVYSKECCLVATKVDLSS